MSTSDLMHLAQVAQGLQNRHGFTEAELETNRGPGSRAAAIALERSRRLSSASLGRILCALPDALLWVDFTKVWPKQYAEVRDCEVNEVPIMQLKCALIILYWLGAPMGVYAGDGWGEAYTGYTLSAY